MASAPRFTRRPLEYQRTRNRGLLLTAFETGLQVLCGGLVYFVESSQLNGSVYPLFVARPADQTIYRCRCDWGRKVHAAWQPGSPVLPCTHQLLVCWYRLAPATRARLCAADPHLLAAQQAGQAALITRRDDPQAQLLVDLAAPIPSDRSRSLPLALLAAA